MIIFNKPHIYKKDGKWKTTKVAPAIYRNLNSALRTKVIKARAFCQAQNKKAEIIAKAPNDAMFYTLNGDYYARHKNNGIAKYDPLSKSWKTYMTRRWDELIEIPNAKKV